MGNQDRKSLEIERSKEEPSILEGVLFQGQDRESTSVAAIVPFYWLYKTLSILYMILLIA